MKRYLGLLPQQFFCQFADQPVVLKPGYNLLYKIQCDVGV